LELTNEYRIEKGIEPLAWDGSLTEIAREHSREMALQGLVRHEVHAGNASIRTIRASYMHITARENIARSRSFSGRMPVDKQKTRLSDLLSTI
jgi:uncharacterized protein YkwD